jgi:hypothetical protein
MGEILPDSAGLPGVSECGGIAPGPDVNIGMTRIVRSRKNTTLTTQQTSRSRLWQGGGQPQDV